MSKFDWGGSVLYMGNTIEAKNLPWHYLPVYILITTPIFYSVLVFIGIMFMILNLRKRILFYREEKYKLLSILWFFYTIISSHNI